MWVVHTHIYIPKRKKGPSIRDHFDAGFDYTNSISLSAMTKVPLQDLNLRHQKRSAILHEDNRYFALIPV